MRVDSDHVGEGVVDSESLEEPIKGMRMTKGLIGLAYTTEGWVAQQWLSAYWGS